jgi:PAS domain S-box-containing protein
MAQPLHVLIAEDNSADAELVVRELRRAGFAPEWTRVDTEADFIAHLHAGIDLVLSDYEMPQFNGLRALELMKERSLELPFILVSGTIGEDVAVTAMKQGASDYLMKDRLARLGQAVVQALAQYRLREEKRRAVQTLQGNAAFIHAVMNSLTASIVVLDEKGAITATNEAWRRFAVANGGSDNLGENYLEVCARSVSAFGNKDAEAAANGIRAVLSGKLDVFTLEYPCHGTNERRWFLMRVSPLGGEHRGVVVAHEKITEIKLAEISLRESEERFRRLIEHASDMIAVVDMAGIIQFQSPSTERVLGYAPKDVTGLNVLDFIHPEDREKVGQRIAEISHEAFAPMLMEYRIRHRDGSWRIFQSTGGAMTDPDGRRMMVVNSRDVTETRKLEEQFLRAQRLEAIGTLSSGIAHDLNNILAPMLMIAPLLRGKLPDAQDAELLTMIESGAQRGANIIRQLLTFSRGIDGERGVVQPRHLLKEMVALMRETFPRDITVEERIAADLWTVTADGTQIHQVLMNLCVNARDAMRNGGKLTLAAGNVTVDEMDVLKHPQAKLGAYVQLTISDSGEGIPRENIDRMFEPFFTTKEIGKGTGLGLSTVLGIVKSHAGFITVYSEPGRGSVFNVHLPADADGKEAMAATGLSVARGAGELILVVDDESPVRRATCLTLEAHNYRVLSAANGREATTLFLQHRDQLRLVLTDIMMPAMNGMALIRVLRALAPRLKIIAASGLLDPERRDELTALGVTTVLAKPFGRDETLRAIQHELALR